MAGEGAATLNSLHPWAWWCWAIGLGLAVNGTTNPFLLTLVALATVAVVLARRTDAPWARSIRAYLVLSAFVIGMRVLFQILIGASSGTTVLFTLPEIQLPAWAVGIRLGGPVTAEALANTGYDALRLAVMLLCIGAANALANPRQALRSVPAALYEASVAVVIALSVAPQLIESGQRVRRARRLRGDRVRGLKSLGSVALPVLADAIERSMALAAGMESRGFARTRGLSVRGTLPLMLASVMAALLGGFLLLSTSAGWLAALLLGLGIAGTALGMRRAGARLAISTYRPHPWRWRETLVAAAGIGAAAVVLVASGIDPSAFSPSTNPLAWPVVTPAMFAVVALVLAPLPLTVGGRDAGVEVARHDERVRILRPHPDAELVRP